MLRSGKETSNSSFFRPSSRPLVLNRRLSTLALAFLATSMDPELYGKYENYGTEAASAMLRMWAQFTADHGRTGVYSI